jgi:hypothetical protein
MDETNVLFARNELFTVVHAPARDAGIQQFVEAEWGKNVNLENYTITKK